MRNTRHLCMSTASITALLFATISSGVEQSDKSATAADPPSKVTVERVNDAEQPSTGTPSVQNAPVARPASNGQPETKSASASAGTDRSTILRAQILLDRARFSPGELDAKSGTNLEAALRAFQSNRGLQVSGQLDDATWTALNADGAPALIEYTVTESDVAGPFHPVPADMMEKAKLKQLGFASAAEALGEKFHSNPQLLTELNPGRSLERAGEKIFVPNVASEPLQKAAKVVVDESDATVAVVDESGKTYAQFPATMGSEHDPLPIGDWKVTAIHKNPPFHYNPDLFWDAKPKDDKATIPPGPNNPVGVVWIDLSKEHYGIHGTPEPSKIGHTESHGCIRVTNWSADALAGAVAAGTPVVLQK
jgi:lipoprotein-anchoring transpeptidase ErfK/SrfK